MCAVLKVIHVYSYICLTNMYGMFFVCCFSCIATYFGGWLIITFSLHTYRCYFQYMYSNAKQDALEAYEEVFFTELI